MSYYSALLGSPYEFQLRTYESDNVLPSGVDYFERDLQNEGKTQDALDILPKSEAPLGDIYRQQFYVKPDIPEDIKPSNTYYSARLKNGLEIPKWSKSSFINPPDLRDEINKANEDIMKRFYSRSVPQRVSDNDRGLD